MPPPRPCWPTLSPMRLREVGCPPRLASLTSWEDWRGSYLYSKLLSSVTERSTLFLKELSFSQTTPTDDAFFNRNWAGACWNRWASPLAMDAAFPCKNKKERGSAGARPLPLRCLSQFFPMEENINYLGKEVLVHKSVYLSPIGWPVIYSRCFSQLDDDKDSLLLDGGFSVLITVRLIRDN